MRRFKWIDWNLSKIAAHALSADEVEAAFDRVFSLQQRDDGSFQMFAEVPSGRRIWVIWRYDREDDQIPDVFGELAEPAIFVITAYLKRRAMTAPTPDHRSPQRQEQDERIASEPQLAPLPLPPDATALPVEAHLARQHRPLAVVGIVEHGLVRPLDPTVKLPERSRVIIVAAEGT